jgi:hypothetical protein
VTITTGQKDGGRPHAPKTTDAVERFEDVRRVEALTRRPAGELLLLPPLTLALAVNLRVFGDSLPIRALALIGMLGPRGEHPRRRRSALRRDDARSRSPSRS